MHEVVRRRATERPQVGEFRLRTGHSSGGRPAGADAASVLARTIERLVVPKLVVSHRGAADADHTHAVPVETDIAAVAALSLDRDAEAVLVYIDALRARGVLVEAIFLELLAPVAARLGALWEEDTRDIADITVASWRLQQVMVALTQDFLAEDGKPLNGGVMLLAPCPGEQHFFGAMMAARFFEREGWDVYSEFDPTCDSLAHLCKRVWFDVIALSLAHDAHVDILAEAVRRMRAASCNPFLHVMLGGYAFSSSPNLAARVGGDCVAHDVRHATHHLQALLAERALHT